MTTQATLTRNIAHTRGANFSLGFRLLPKPKRQAVYAAYSVCRVADDIVDEVGALNDRPGVLDRLGDWAREVERAYAGQAGHPITIALAGALAHHPIPKKAFLDLIEGCRWDLERNRYATFAELEGYCELVAVTISEISLAIFGRRSEKASIYGRNLAMALQLTNICRDVGEDARRNRIYLPLDEMGQWGVAEEQILSGRLAPEAYSALMKMQCDRARRYFAEANPLPPLVDGDSRRAVRVMGGVYRRVLDRVAQDPVAAYSRRAELPRWQRLTAICAGLIGRPYVA